MEDNVGTLSHGLCHAEPEQDWKTFPVCVSLFPSSVHLSYSLMSIKKHIQIMSTECNKVQQQKFLTQKREKNL